MIKSVTVTNYLGESKKLILIDPYESGFIFKNISGISAPKATINTTQMATKDGSLFNSARAENRNIVFEFQLLDVPTVEKVRQETYKYFPIKQRVTLLFETDNRICEAYGYVESNEANIFSNAESVQISVVCDDPYFYSTEITETIFYGIEPGFEFIFSNESLTKPLIEFGVISQKTEQMIWYDGDAQIGVTINIHATGPAKMITIYNMRTRERFSINTDKLESMTGGPIQEGDDITITTIRGEKNVTLLRGGNYLNVLNCVDKNADWFLLAKGENTFGYTAESGLTNLRFEIYNRSIYEGL